METTVPGAEPTAPAPGGATPVPFRITRRAAVCLLLVLTTAAAVVFVPAPWRAAGEAASSFRNVRWGFVPALIVLSVLHYVCAALALRGASGRPLPLLPTTLAQFTAAAANRVTPGGLGAVAVNTRYLVCRGVPLPRAAVAVAVLQVAGVPADLLLLAAVLCAAGGEDHVLDAMGRHAAAAAGLVPPLPLLVAAAALLPAALLYGRRAARSTAVTRALGGLTDLCRRPRDLLLTLGASAATTLVLGLAFALSVFAVPGTGIGPAATAALLAAYLVGAAAGAAIPSPGGVGSTEAALTAALAALGIPAAPALQAVLLFRLTTFWAPVPIGLLTHHTLRRPTSLA